MASLKQFFTAGFFIALLLSGDSALSWAASDAGLPPLRVAENLLVADGKPVRLRGIDWGWWHLQGTRYTEEDMRRQAGWGANLARLAFSYGDLEGAGHAGAWNETGFRQLDDVVAWGKRYKVYTVLDMHVAPGGQDTAPYCDGGHNLLWTDPSCQERFIALWQEIARRYRNHPEVAAYELMNEPRTGQPTPQALCHLYSRAIDAIRLIDPDKIIVIDGDAYAAVDSLVDGLVLPDKNLLYTFHFYGGIVPNKATGGGLYCDRKTLREKMKQAFVFAKRHPVPVWVGEFGCEASGLPPGFQAQWVGNCISVFEEAGFHWTYWNYRETTGPGSMALQAEHPDGEDYPLNEDLLKQLCLGWASPSLDELKKSDKLMPVPNAIR